MGYFHFLVDNTQLLDIVNGDMNTKLKARVAAETLSDGSVVFNVMIGTEEFATPPTLQEAQRICEDFNLRYFPTGDVAPTLPPWFMQAGQLAVTIVDDLGNQIAECQKFGAGCVRAEQTAPWHRAEANARLLSAAPELLEACKIALAHDDNEAAWETMREALNCAVAKAEGTIL